MTEILPPLPPEEESPVFEAFKKIMIRLLALLLILLMVSYVLGYYAANYIESKLESEQVNKETFIIQTNGKTITFTETAYKKLNAIYFANLKHEFKACLLGTTDGTTYTIQYIVEPEVVSQTPFQVTSAPCPSKTIIDLHSHPFKKCIASATDLNHLKRLKQANPHVLLAVMCEQDRFSIYT